LKRLASLTKKNKRKEEIMNVTLTFTFTLSSQIWQLWICSRNVHNNKEETKDDVKLNVFCFV